ncbi:MAG TPA: hypothetical protein VK806_07925 [Bacteroidia bacterium]|nr:hypothetical protein [Bacteroidia bacterium]
MKATLLISFLLLFGFTQAQNIKAAYDSKEIQALQKGPLYVIATGDETFDDCFQAAVAACWKIGPYKVVSTAEASNLLKDESNVFIAPVTSFEKGFACKVASPLTYDSGRGVGIELSIFHGSKNSRSLDNIDQNSEITSSIFPLYMPSLATTGMIYAVKNLNDNVQIVLDRKINPVSKWTGKKNASLQEDFCKNTGALKTKTLLIDEDMTAFVLPEKMIKEKYKYKYLILEGPEIAAVMNTTASKDYCVLADCKGSLEIYDCGTRAKIWSGKKNVGSNLIKRQYLDALNSAIEEAKN